MNVIRIAHTAHTVYIFHTLKIKQYLVIAQGENDCIMYIYIYILLIIYIYIYIYTYFCVCLSCRWFSMYYVHYCDYIQHLYNYTYMDDINRSWTIPRSTNYNTAVCR